MKRRGAESGFSLLETLLAMTLLAVAGLALVPLFVAAAQTTDIAADFSDGGAGGVDRLEQLRTQPFRDLVAGGSLTSNVTGYFDSSDPEVLIRWQIQANATPLPSRTIRVRVIPQGRTVGNAKEVAISVVRSQ